MIDEPPQKLLLYILSMTTYFDLQLCFFVLFYFILFYFLVWNCVEVSRLYTYLCLLCSSRRVVHHSVSALATEIHLDTSLPHEKAIMRHPIPLWVGQLDIVP
jgi:hypothetical protein